MALISGKPAPAFSLKDQDNNTVKLSDFSGRKILVYFYPRANTPGCTTQSCEIQEALPDLSAAGVDAVGISPDEPEAQKKFADNYGLTFPLLADTDHAVADSWGTWGEKSMYGNKFMGIIRSAFLIDENGIVIESWYKISPKKTVPTVRKALAG